MRATRTVLCNILYSLLSVTRCSCGRAASATVDVYLFFYLIVQRANLLAASTLYVRLVEVGALRFARVTFREVHVRFLDACFAAYYGGRLSLLRSSTQPAAILSIYARSILPAKDIRASVSTRTDLKGCFLGPSNAIGIDRSLSICILRSFIMQWKRIVRSCFFHGWNQGRKRAGIRDKPRSPFARIGKRFMDR